MKRFLRNILFFLLLALPCCTLLCWALGGTGIMRTVSYHLSNYGHLFTRLQEARQCRDVNVLFLGSSHSYRTFDPQYYEQQGLSTFNLGSSNQTPIQTAVLLDALLDTLNPRFVVFEVHPDIMSNDGVEGAVDLISNAPVSFATWRMAIRMQNAKAIGTALYATLWNPSRMPGFTEDSLIGEVRYQGRGFCTLPDRCYSPQPCSPRDVTPLPEQMKALEQCLAMLRERDIPYILVQVPATKPLTDSWQNYDVFIEQVSSLGEFVIPTPPLDDSLHYYDEDHLNNAGIALFNDYFYHTILSPRMER